MKYDLIKIPELSGAFCSIYTVIFEDEDETLLDKFILENKNSFKSETKFLIERLRAIGKRTGARKDFFKENEGNPGDGVCALYDEGRKLRLYCIKYGTQLVVVGGGGPKPKTIRALQEDEKLKDENFLLRDISKEIIYKIKNGEIVFSEDFLDFIGKLKFNED